jgi:hypothetical protein
MKFVYIKFDGRSLKVSNTAVFVIVNLCIVRGAALLSMFIVHVRVKFHKVSAVIPGYCHHTDFMQVIPLISCKSLRIFRGAPSAICGPGSIVSIATGYALDGPGIKSRWGRNFPHLSRPALGPTQPSVQWVPGLSWGKKRSERDTDPSPLLVPWS